MKKKLLSHLEVARIVESEGLGYAIQSYLDPTEIRDAILQKYWKEASDLLDKIEDILDDAIKAEEANED